MNMSLHKSIIEAGLDHRYELFLKVLNEKDDSAYNRITGLKIAYYLTPEQKTKLERVLECYKYVTEERVPLAFPPSIGRGGIEHALSMSDDELEKLIHQANEKKIQKL